MKVKTIIAATVLGLASAGSYDGCRVHTGSKEDCNGVCKLTTDCGWWSYDSRTSLCWMHLETGWAPENKSNCWSGNRDGDVLYHDINLVHGDCMCPM